MPTTIPKLTTIADLVRNNATTSIRSDFVHKKKDRPTYASRSHQRAAAAPIVLYPSWARHFGLWKRVLHTDEGEKCAGKSWPSASGVANNTWDEAADHPAFAYKNPFGNCSACKGIDCALYRVSKLEEGVSEEGNAYIKLTLGACHFCWVEKKCCQGNVIYYLPDLMQYAQDPDTDDGVPIPNHFDPVGPLHVQAAHDVKLKTAMETAMEMAEGTREWLDKLDENMQGLRLYPGLMTTGQETGADLTQRATASKPTTHSALVYSPTVPPVASGKLSIGIIGQFRVDTGRSTGSITRQYGRVYEFPLTEETLTLFGSQVLPGSAKVSSRIDEATAKGLEEQWGDDLLAVDTTGG